MVNVKWVRWKNGGGPRYNGSCQYDPPKPWGPWSKTLGVVARCEGKHDTVVMYDETGVTFGFMQWTMTSGRLQRFLESLKSIPMDDERYEDGHPVRNLFCDLFCDDNGIQVFKPYGFNITSGRLTDGAVVYDPRRDKKQIADLCMGRMLYKGDQAAQKRHAKQLASLFAEAGKHPAMHRAQEHFAKQELKRTLDIERPVLGEFKTIRGLFPQDEGVWDDVPIAPVFFNLWQNNPGAAYRLYMNTWKKFKTTPTELTRYLSLEEFFEEIWRRLCKSRFGNWGLNSKRYKAGKGKPRVFRIQKALEEFYQLRYPVK